MLRRYLVGAYELGALAGPGTGRHRVLLVNALDKLPVRRRQLGLDRRAVVVFGHAIGQHQIHAKREFSNCLPDPGEFVRDFFWRVAGRSEHAESTRTADGCDYRSTVGEAKDWMGQPQALAQRGL